jgi:hypothetical protein
MKKHLFAVFFLLILISHLFPFVWERVYEGNLNGNLTAGTYSGSVNYSKPFFVDIDGDNNFDLFIGGDQGNLHFYENIGTVWVDTWSFGSDFYDSIDAGDKSDPAFADIDADGDFDLFMGIQDGTIYYFRNDGTSASPLWTYITDFYGSIDVWMNSSPSFVDIDADGDFDLFVGEQDGSIHFYRNEGTPSNANFIFDNDSLDIGTRSLPTYVDIDADGDFDLLCGNSEGTVTYYRNDGTPTLQNWTFVTNTYNGMDVGNTTSPFFCDIDNDGDYDMWIGEYVGNINYYRNIGTPSNASWELVRQHPFCLDVGSSSIPIFIDMDLDNDYDLFFGRWWGRITFYENTGSSIIPQWTIVTLFYESIDVGWNSHPDFVDIDGDNDPDLFIGEVDGNINYYRNDGTPGNPVWTFIGEFYNGIDIGDRCAPTFADIDADNDFDLFIGEQDGNINYYRNDGTTTFPSWTLVTENYNSITVGTRSIPRFFDLDKDGDLDLFIGNGDGVIYYYKNDGSASSPVWSFITSKFADVDVGENCSPFLVDIEDDSFADLFVGERWGGLNYYHQVPATDSIPPLNPYIYGKKSLNDVFLWWSPVTEDTMGEPETVNYYVVYRNTSPDFVPGPADSFGAVPSPDTTFIDTDAVIDNDDYYYLVMAVDVFDNRSKKSNMGFKLKKSLEENPSATDKNWVSLPYNSEYGFFSDITLEFSPNGVPLYKITKRDPSQMYASRVWIGFPIGWTGDYTVEKGEMYEKSVDGDTAIILVGSHDPYYAVPLNENPEKTDKNWVSIPYNAVYSTASDITDEFSPNGTPIYKITKRNPNQMYTSRVWIGPPINWSGNFTVTRGEGFEISVNQDTVWTPSIYSNVAKDQVPGKGSEGRLLASGRREYTPLVSPLWGGVGTKQHIIGKGKKKNRERTEEGGGESHTLYGKVSSPDVSSIKFITFLKHHPEKAMDESFISSFVETHKNVAYWVADIGNLPFTWKSEDEVITILGSEESGGTVSHEGYYMVVRTKLDERIDPQECMSASMVSMPKPAAILVEDMVKVSWNSIDDEYVIGYSLYRGEDGFTFEDRLNNEIITDTEFTDEGIEYGKTYYYALKLVYFGGYESPYLSGNSQVGEYKSSKYGEEIGMAPKVFGLHQNAPNPFGTQTEIRYQLPVRTQVSLVIYDVTGRQVRRLVSGVQDIGFYNITWDGRDERGNRVSGGIYFAKFKAGEYQSLKKMIMFK